MTAPLWLGSFSSGGEDTGATGTSRPGRPQVVRPVQAEVVDPDAELVAALRQDNESEARRAFEIVFRTYYPILCDFATRYVGARDVAGEVVTDVFVRIWDRRRVWELQVTLRAYLYSAVANASRNRRRDMEREYRRATRSVADGDDPVWMGAREVAPDVLLDSTDTRDRLWRVVEELGDDGMVLVLRWRHALDYEDIARVLGVSAAAAQKRHSRAMARLRVALPELFREDVG